MPEISIFINYRIADTPVEARLLFTQLANHFGAKIAFLDKKNLEYGTDWPDEMKANVQNAKVLLILIKDEAKWLGVGRLGNRRMDDPKDWVRLEIETALSDGAKTIVPVLIDNAAIPPADALPASLHHLHRKQACKITTEKWDTDLAALLEQLEKHIPRKKTDSPETNLDPLSEYPLPMDVPDPVEFHPAPYLGLPFFSRTAARLFFGRTREILAFFSLLEHPDIRLISLFGHSGVGKSSFLAAGVRPRLETTRQVHYERRIKTAAKGLATQLESLRQVPKTPGKPPLYILDQVEELFTDPLPGEREAFVQCLRLALREEPETTVVLGFRSDYHLDLFDLLARVDCRREDLPLRPLGHAALVEAIEGVWRDPVLSKRYALELEKGFAEYVVRNLMHNESGGAAAILQNRLLKLYDRAKARRSPGDPLVRLSIADYEDLNQNTAAEEELLDFQIQRLREVYHLAADDRTLLEILDQFVVDKPTAGTLPKNKLPDDPQELRVALRRVNLLTELPESQALRLSHDLLAPIVRKRYQQFLVNETERLELENVRLHLREVKKLLSNVDFPAAWKEFEMAALRDILPEEVWPFAFELAFAFLYAGHRDAGEKALLTCVQYLDFAKKIPPPFPDNTFPDQRDCSELLEFLRRCAPAAFKNMERRYFPHPLHVEGGTFEMGDVLGDKADYDETVHPVTLSDFQLAETSTTWQQYGLFCLATARELPHDEGWGRAERPVINVSWYEAVEFANWLSGAHGLRAAYRIDKDNKDPNNENEYDKMKWTVAIEADADGFRLPTEAEWEFAARERGRAVRFGNGKNTADPAEMNFDALEQYQKEYFVAGEYRRKTTPVRQFSPNALGFFDMSGNVWEWCQDWYGDYEEANKPISNPIGPAAGSSRVYRGGSWDDESTGCRVAYRLYWDLGDRRINLGFRLARTY